MWPVAYSSADPLTFINRALEQAKPNSPLDGLRACCRPELVVDRPEMGFYRAAGDEESGCDLRIGTRRQQLQDAQLGSGQLLVEQAARPGGIRLRGAHLYRGTDQLFHESVVP